jgi:hypothetical protein
VLARYDLGRTAAGYFRSELEKGKGLARELLAFPVERGTFTTYLPPGIAPDRLTDFESGGFESWGLTSHLAEEIATHLSETASGLCVFEEQFIQTTVGRLPDVPFFVVGADIYMFAHRQTPLEVVEKIARKGHTYPAIGVVSALPSEQPLPSERSTQEASLLLRLANAATHIIIGAYDGEGWLTWQGRTQGSRSSSSQARRGFYPHPSPPSRCEQVTVRQRRRAATASAWRRALRARAKSLRTYPPSATAVIAYPATT